MNFNQLIDMMYRAKGITRLADVARELDVSPQAVSNWKARNQVPYKYVVMVNERFGGGDQEGSEIEESSGAGESRGEEVQTPLPYGPYAFPDEDEISLWEIIDVLKENLRLILITPTVICILTIIHVLFIAQPVFTSTATIIPSTGGSSTSSNLRSMASQFGINIPSDNNASPTFVYPEIIQSRTLARKLLYRKFDTEEFGPGQPLIKILTYGDEEPEVGPDTLEKFAIKGLQGMIEVEKSSGTGILTLSVSAGEPQLAADLASALIQELDRHQQEFKTTRVSEKRQFIEDRMTEVNIDLEKSEESLKDFRERNRQILGSPALLLLQERLIREMEVQKGIFITLKQEYELAKIQEVEEATVVYVLDPPEAPLFRSGPKKKQSVLLAGILGIGLGIGMAFVRNWYDSSKTENE